ncbi:MAG TPA: tRNA lysidine(34) synthetase TilS [Streptosporangiaceae bacterium]|nr:tRNA lysidine(34) synthetase TilS [Streptosporangiaceae bacterium]
MGPHPAVAAVRRAAREGLSDLPPGSLVLAACSGGADSLALAAALAFTAPKLSLRAGGVTVDHGLQPGSAERARRVAGLLTELGLEPVERVAAEVGRSGGPEAAARTARYAALDETARRLGAAAVLLGHTLDDQAETVLLGLARGSGARSLAGMPARAGRYRRPLLGVRRGATCAACTALGLATWDDPHNHDPAFTRARVRHEVLPTLERALGPGVAAALARTAGQLRADGEALYQWADIESERLRGSDGGLDAAALTALPLAVRSRVLHRGAVAAGCPPGALTAGHIGQIEELLTGWHGQRWIDLPAGVRAVRRCGKLLFTTDAEHATGSAPQSAGTRSGGSAES